MIFNVRRNLSIPLIIHSYELTTNNFASTSKIFSHSVALKTKSKSLALVIESINIKNFNLVCGQRFLIKNFFALRHLKKEGFVFSEMKFNGIYGVLIQ